MSGWRGKGGGRYPEKGTAKLCRRYLFQISFFFSFLCWDTPVPKNCAQCTVEVGGLAFYEFLCVCFALAHIP